MSTAVLLSGHCRTFSACLPSLRHHVFNKLDDPHFFASLVDDDTAGQIHLLEQYYPGKVFVEKVTQPTIEIGGKAAPADLGESQRHHMAAHAPYAVSASLQAILRQLWHLNRVWEFRSETAQGAKFSTYVRCRPDLQFKELSGRPLITAPQWLEAYLPWWSRCGGVNDRFGVMDFGAAEAYFMTFTRWEKLVAAGCPLHPESLVAESLRTQGVHVRNTLCAAFESLRPDGTRVPMREYPGEFAAFIQACSRGE